MKSTFDKLMQGLGEVESYLSGETVGFRVHVPEQVDVKRIRSRLRMTQSGFSHAFGFSLDAVRHWEGGRRTPESSARAYLTIIDKAPGVVMGILDPRVRSSKRVVATKAHGESVHARRRQGSKLSKKLGYAKREA
jgi:putative transcriptional regulator